MRTEADRRPGGHAAIGYALVTLVAAVVAIGLVGGSGERAGGTLMAWAVQSLAFWRLSEALRARRDARGVWVGGMAARGLGLMVCGVLALTGLTGKDLPASYGISMLALLLAEALWLARSAPSAVGGGVGAKNQLDRTHSTG